MASTKATTGPRKASAKMANTGDHPRVATMVTTAVSELDDSKGSSLAAIKKYILANFNGIDMTRAAPLIRRFLKKAVDEGVLTQKKNSYRSGKDGSAAPSSTADKDNNKKTKTAAAEKKAKPAKPAKTVIRKPIPKKSAKPSAAKRTPAKKMAPVKMTKKSPAKKTMKKPVVKKLAKKVTKK